MIRPLNRCLAGRTTTLEMMATGRLRTAEIVSLFFPNGRVTA